MTSTQVPNPHDALMAGYLAEVAGEMGSDATADEISFHARIRYHEFLAEAPADVIDAFYEGTYSPALRH